MVTTALGCLTPSSNSQAISFTSFDARSMAMGGAGVATAEHYNAALFNPSLLTRGDTLAGTRYIRPYLGARLIDRDGFLDSLDAFKESNNKNDLDLAIENYRARVSRSIDSVEDVRDVLTYVETTIGAARRLLADYESLSDKPLRIAASAGLTGGYTGSESAFSILFRRNRVGGAAVRLSKHDLDAVNYVIDTLEGVNNGVGLLLQGEELPLAATLLTIAAQNPQLPVREDLTSTVEVLGANTTETGFSYSPVEHTVFNWHWGMTLKAVEFETVDYEQRIIDADIDNFDVDEHQITYRDLNIDIGLNRQLSRRWRLGAVVRNIVPYDYRTVRDNTIELRPLARLGLAYDAPRYTITADVDITGNDPVGFDPDKRYLAMGAEWRVRRGISLRGGYRYNTVSGDELYSAGLGLGSHGFQADLAVAARDDELGISLQLAAYF